MTTIAWDGKTLSADSRVTNNGYIATDNYQKIVITDPKSCIFDGLGVVGLATSGDAGVDRLLVHLMKKDGGITPETTIPEQMSFLGFLLTEGGVVYWVASYEESPILAVEIINEPEAIGSGAHYAKAAMALGKTSAEAVEFTKQFDTCTGGPVCTLTVENIL